MSPWVHANNSVAKFGGNPNDYLQIHEFLDMTKTHYVGFQHRAILHNTFGIYICEQIFGPIVTNSEGKEVETRYIVMEHIKEDLGFVPTIKEWVDKIPLQEWMNGKKKESSVTLSLENFI